MVEEPRIVVTVERRPNGNRAGHSGPSARRGSTFRRFDRYARAVCDLCREHFLEHVGLGVGTQLELAVATGICQCWGERPTFSTSRDRWVAANDLPSAFTVFFRAGLFWIGESVVPMTSRTVEHIPFPADWRVVMLIPPVSSEWHGDREASAFESIGAESNAHMESLLHDAIVPAIIAEIYATFADALHEYNAAAGNFYVAAQGFRHHSFSGKEPIEWLIRHGAKGAGQSFWGPTAFGFFDGADEAAAIAKSDPGPGRCSMW